MYIYTFIYVCIYIFIHTYIHISGVYGGCVTAYQDFSKKWGHILDADMTDEDIEGYGYVCVYICINKCIYIYMFV
jgi:hypothetical protein